jgi:hypothetical protein
MYEAFIKVVVFQDRQLALSPTYATPFKIDNSYMSDLYFFIIHKYNI